MVKSLFLALSLLSAEAEKTEDLGKKGLFFEAKNNLLFQFVLPLVSSQGNLCQNPFHTDFGRVDIGLWINHTTGGDVLEWDEADEYYGLVSFSIGGNDHVVICPIPILRDYLNLEEICILGTRSEWDESQEKWDESQEEEEELDD